MPVLPLAEKGLAPLDGGPSPNSRGVWKTIQTWEGSCDPFRRCHVIGWDGTQHDAAATDFFPNSNIIQTDSNVVTHVYASAAALHGAKRQRANDRVRGTLTRQETDCCFKVFRKKLGRFTYSSVYDRQRTESASSLPHKQQRLYLARHRGTISTCR